MMMIRKAIFALYTETLRRLKQLVARGQVWRPETQNSDPVAMLRQMQESDPADPKRAELYLDQVYKDRKRWRDH